MVATAVAGNSKPLIYRKFSVFSVLSFVSYAILFALEQWQTLSWSIYRWSVVFISFSWCEKTQEWINSTFITLDVHYLMHWSLSTVMFSVNKFYIWLLWNISVSDDPCISSSAGLRHMPDVQHVANILFGIEVFLWIKVKLR